MCVAHALVFAARLVLNNPGLDSWYQAKALIATLDTKAVGLKRKALRPDPILGGSRSVELSGTGQ